MNAVRGESFIKEGLHGLAEPSFREKTVALWTVVVE